MGKLVLWFLCQTLGSFSGASSEKKCSQELKPTPGDDISLVQVHLGIHLRHKNNDRHSQLVDVSGAVADIRSTAFSQHSSVVFRAIAWTCVLVSLCLSVSLLLYDHWRTKMNSSFVQQVVDTDVEAMRRHAIGTGDNSTDSGLLDVRLRSPQGDSTRDGVSFKGLEVPGLEEIHKLAESGGVLALMQKLTAEHHNRLAIVDNADSSAMTYGELFAAKEALTQGLEECGIGRGHIVALLLKPSKTLVIATLGVMHLGAVWLPLDVEAPPARLQQLLDVASVRLCLGLVGMTKIGSSPLLLLSPEAECVRVVIGPPDSVAQSGAAALLSSGYEAKRTGSQTALPGGTSTSPTPPRSAAVFFTSGSTGAPKGVVYGHDMLLHGVVSMARLCSMDAATVSVLKSPPAWAVVEYELFPALVTGGTLVCDARCQKDPVILAQILAQQGVTVLMASEQILRALLDGPWSTSPSLLKATATSLSHMMNVGAPILLDVCAEVQNKLRRVQIHNVYGCTECSCTQWTYNPSLLSSTCMKNAPAGLPQPGVEVYIVNNDLQLLPNDQFGEICLGGAFLANGYLNDSEQTQTCFVSSPEGNGRMYRTGDLGRWSPDPGQSDVLVLEVIGRVDRQLNLRGMRIAPEEIESVIKQVPNVKETVVVSAADSIVAYIEGQGDDLVDQVQKLCQVGLTAQMRPSLIQNMTLPRLANGKIDVQELAAQADKDVTQLFIESVDSFGIIRKSGQDKIIEDDTLGAARGIAMASIFLWHWYWIWIPGVQNAAHPVPVGRFSAPDAQVFSNNIPSRWLRMLLSGFLGFEWSTQIFIIAAAYQHRRHWEEKRPGQIQQDMWMAALFIILWWPAGDLFQFILQGFQNTDISVDQAWASHRWFLACLLVCRLLQSWVLVPLASATYRLSNRYLAQAGQAFFVFSWWMLATAYLGWSPNLCPNMDAQGFAFRVICIFVPGSIYYPTSASDSSLRTYCPLVSNVFEFHGVALYIAAWCYAHPVATWAKSKHWLSQIGPLPVPWGLLFLAQLVVFGFYSMMGYIDYESNFMYVLSCLLSINLLTALAQWRSRAWPLSRLLAHSGHFSFGTYCFHVFMICAKHCNSDARAASTAQTSVEEGIFYFSFKNKVFFPGPIQMMEILSPYGGLVQLVLLAAYPCAFCFLIGAPLQMGCLRILQLAEQYAARILKACARYNCGLARRNCVG